MSLSDLKKNNASKNKKRNFTVDEFIADADNYAQGQPEIVSAVVGNSEQIKEHKQKASTPRIKQATFSLGTEVIEQLNMLAKESKLSKSHILRILISELALNNKDQPLSPLLNSKIE